MKKRINLHLMTIAVVAIIATMIFVAAVAYDLFRGQMQEDLKTYAHLLNHTKILQEMTEYIYDFQKDNIRITVIDTDGKVVFESCEQADTKENHARRPEIVSAMARGEGTSVRKSDTLGKNAFYYALRMEDGKILRVSKEADSIWSVFRQAGPAIFTIAAVLIIFCFGIAHFLTKSLVEPIEKIAQNVDHLGEPDTYEELAPFVATIKKQHEDILRNAGMRQEFTANVSHELKTPLTSISGYSELIESGMASDEDVVRFAREIHRNSNRLLTLINDVIRLSQLDVAEWEENYEIVDMKEVAETCVNMLQINAEKHEVTLEFSGASCKVRSEKQMMEELVYNLCDNAIRYNNKNGKVKVSVRPENDKAVLVVEDTGIGIPKEHQERVFERFYRVDKSRSKSTGGTGLGLAIVKHIVAQNHAAIQLESEIGKGTRITVTFELQNV